MASAAASVSAVASTGAGSALNTLNFTRSIVYFLTSSLGKLPVVYLVMLLWSGLVLGFTGQAFMFLTYVVTMLISYGVVRPLIAASITDLTGPYKFVYSLIPSLTTHGKQQVDYLSVYMGIPSSIMENILSSKEGGSSFLSRFLLLGLPDAMIFPSSFLYGYGAATADNGATDARNMPMLFLVLLTMLLQISVTQMGFLPAFLNLAIGLFVGVLSGSFVAGDPNLGPFSLQNQQFKVVVQNSS
jgi:hypothetical protein